MQRATIAGAILTIAMSMPFAAFAAPHPLQQQLQAQLDAAQATQDAAERAKGGRRQELISEHMQMLKEAMRQMEATKPQAGISVQEHDEWIIEQQHLMDQALHQMMKDQELLMPRRK